MKKEELKELAKIKALLEDCEAALDKSFRDEDDGFSSNFYELEILANGRWRHPYSRFEFEASKEGDFYTSGLGFLETYEEFEDEDEAEEWRSNKMDEEEERTIEFYSCELKKIRALFEPEAEKAENERKEEIEEIKKILENLELNWTNEEESKKVVDFLRNEGYGTFSITSEYGVDEGLTLIDELLDNIDDIWGF